jgi:peptidyl-prolyl cis-trans isomerase D
MITAIRSLFSSTFGKIFALAFIGLIGVLFALSDVGNTGFGGGMGDTTVADVGDEQIGLAELRQSINQAYDRARQQQPGLTREAFIEEGGFDAVLDDVIQGAAFRQFARDLGFGVSKRLVDGQIADAFAGVSGSFDQARYNAYLRESGVSELQLRRQIETLLLMQQLGAPAGTTPRTGSAMAFPYAALLVEERRGQATFIPASSFAPSNDPGDAVLQQYLKDNRSRFSIPERRILQYAVFDRNVAPVPAVTDKEIADLYKANAARFAASETRRFMQVIAPDQAAANAIATKVRGGTSLAAAAQAAGLTAAPSGDVTQTAYSGLTNAAAAKAAFAAKRGDVLGPTQTDLGWSVAQVDAITTTAAKTLEQATPEIRAQLEKNKAEEALITYYNAVQDAANGGVSIEEIAGDRKLTLVETPAILPSGRAPAQPAYTLPADLAPMMAQAFQGASEGETHLAQLVENEKFAVYAVKSIVAAAPPPFAQIRGDLLADWKLAQGQKIARDKARGIVKAVEGKASFADAVRAAGPQVGSIQTIGGRRGELGRNGERVPPELALLFSMAPNTVKTLEIPGNRGWMVLQLGEVKRPDAKEVEPALVAGLSQSLSKQFGPELAEQLIAEAKRRVGVKINQKLVKQLRDELTGKTPVAQ